MQAITLTEFGGPEVLALTEVEDPVPGPGQVLIEVAATSVNRPDLVQREGNYRPPPGESPILGLEVAGTVAALGEGVHDWHEGERVMALIGGGGYAERALAYAAHLMPVPESMSFEEAACVCETYLTAYLNLFRLAALRNGETVLLHGGGGGVNTAALHLCAALVPDSATLVTASPGKLERVAALGARHVIDYTSQDFAEAVRTLTERRGCDVILDHLGASYLAGNLKSLAVAGRLVIIGVMGGAEAKLNLALLMVKRQQIIGSVLRSRSSGEKAALIADFRERVLPLFAERRIVPLIDKCLALARAAEAHTMMQESRHFGKIVLRP